MKKRTMIILCLLAMVCGGAKEQDDLDALMARTYAAQLHRDSIDSSVSVYSTHFSVK